MQELGRRNRLRVGLLVDTLVGGGAERIALNFAQVLHRLGHDAHVIMVKDEVEHDPESVPLHSLSRTGALSKFRPVDKFLLVRKLKKVIAEIEQDGQAFDFYISNSEVMDRLSGLAGLPFAFIRYRNAMTPFIMAKIGNKTGLKRHIRTLRWYREFRKVYGGRHIVTVSNALEKEIVEDVGVKPASIVTIYNPFSAERLTRLAKEPAALPTAPYIIYVARISGRKAQHILVEAYAKANLPHKLVLLGGTTSEGEVRYLRSLEELISKLGLEDRIILPGFVTNPYPWIKNASLMAMSSVGEGLPTVLIESLILGTPVVSTDCPTGPREILIGDLATFLSPVNDIDTLAANMRRALENYPALSEARLERFSDEYAIGRYIDHFESLRVSSR